jgi:tetratricopeptide (TPR) repeat protein
MTESSKAPDELVKLVKIGNHYAANGQWANAMNTFWRVTDALYNCLNGFKQLELAPLGIAHEDPNLNRALEEIQDRTVAIKDKSTDPLIRNLTSALRAAYDVADIAEAAFVYVFKHPTRKHPMSSEPYWTLVYHDREPIWDFLERASHTFVVRTSHNIVHSWRPSRTQVSQISYCLAHFGQAWVNSMVQLYMEYQILADGGAPAIMEAARHYQRALQLRPYDSWTLAQMGEVHRTLANGYLDDLHLQPTPDRHAHDEQVPDRDSLHKHFPYHVGHYLKALYYYYVAFSLNPDDYWAHAHFGAAVVNARAFLADADFAKMAKKLRRSTKFLKLDFTYLASSSQTSSSPKRWLLNQATRSLLKAQELRGGLYPWAQLYYAGILVVKSMDERETSDERLENAQLAMAVMNNALSLESKLLTNAFEPRTLYINAFFQLALLALQGKQYPLAWSYTRFGMQHLFNDKFLPGADALVGFLMLLNISARAAALKEDTRRDEVNTYRAPTSKYGTVSVAGIPIPQFPWANTSDMVSPIAHVAEFGETMTHPFLNPKIKCNPKIRMGLLQVAFTLENIRTLVSKLYVAPDVHASWAISIKERLTTLRNKIVCKLNANMYLELVEDEQDINLKHIVTFLNTGKPNYAMLLALRKGSTC